jgi:signal transduction histidine kinase
MRGSAKFLQSSVFRLALLYASLSLGAVVILLGYIYWATAGHMARQIHETIEAEIRGLAEHYRRRDLAGLTRIIAERVSRDSNGASVYLLTDDDFSPLVGNLDRWPDAPIGSDGWTRFRLLEWGADKSEEHEARARTFLLRGGLRLLVGRDVRELEATRRLILNALAWGLAITVGLAVGIGLIMSSRVASRIEAINQTGREIMEGDLSRRVPRDDSGDDFDQLAANLNLMLERIEGLMASVRQVSDNIAHDLRTPLTRLRTRLELARDGDSQRARSTLESAIEDADELLGTFNALLRIARIESGSQRSAFAELDMASLVADVAELYEPVASGKEQHLEVQSAGKLIVSGDRNLLFQALANLVDNAIKYTPDGGRITLSARQIEGRVVIMVADTGPGVPAKLRERVFERFYRVDDSRATQGNGLGLSLVRAVANLHGAEILLTDNQPGLKVELRLAL